MRCCDSLPPISPRFVSFAGRYHRCVRGSSPPAPDAEPWINRELVGGISSRLARWKRQGLPSSRRYPCDHSPYSSDPGVTRQAEWTMSELPGAAPATDHDEGSPRVVISGLNRTAFDLAVYASQGWSPAHHARLASGCWSSSTGRDWLPAGLHLKGFKLTTILPSRAFLAQGQTLFLVSCSIRFRPEKPRTKFDPKSSRSGPEKPKTKSDAKSSIMRSRRRSGRPPRTAPRRCGPGPGRWAGPRIQAARETLPTTPERPAREIEKLTSPLRELARAA